MRKKNKIGRPSLFWLFTEGGRAVAELGFSIPYRTFFADKEKGDGHPVLVIPGFMSSDFSTGPLRKFIKKSGYTPYKWELGRNTAELEFLDKLSDKIEEIYNIHNEQVSLIGWSLGGVYARQLAKRKPDLVRQVITLGSPFKGINEPNNVAWIYNLISERDRIEDLNPELFKDIPLPAPVPTTAIYSKEDGIVPWQLCLEEEDEIHQNVQVRGSHFGLGVNPGVLEIIADRLSHTREDWTYFVTKSLVKELLFYPSY